jgi:hypothetical protein
MTLICEITILRSEHIQSGVFHVNNPDYILNDHQDFI